MDVRRLVLLSLVAALAAPVALGPTPSASAAPATIDRASGSDRIATALAVSRSSFASADTAVLAAAGGFADALAAAPLAAAVRGPVLLNPVEDLDPRVRTELDRLGASRVLLMGGTSAQSEQVAARLRAAGFAVERIAGSDRAATAAAAADAAVAAWHAAGDGDAGEHVLIALGSHPVAARAWPDALAAGPLAGHAHRPILLVTPEAVPPATRRALDDLGAVRATVIGGPAAVPDAVARQLGVPYDRLGGATRYHTAALLADAATAAGADPSQVVVATGTSFPDALGAGPAAVRRGGVVVLVDGRDLDASVGTRDWLVGRRDDVARVLVAGGAAAVAEPVLGQLDWATGGFRAPSLRRVTVASGLDTPLEVTAPPGDPRLFIAERPGRIRVLVEGRLETYLDISSRVRTDGERGLLGLAFPADHATSGRFFVHYSRASDGATVLAEYRQAADPDRGDRGSERVLLTVGQPAANHNGGTVAFAPDGTLHLFLGDGGGAGDQFGHGQDPSTLLGTVVRLDVSRPGTARVPADNPYAGGGAGDPRVLHHGLRNPFRASFDAVTGMLYIADVGQSDREEVDVVPAAARGRNFGWSVMEGTRCVRPGCDQGGLTLPVAEYTHADGCSITGGHVHRGRIGMLRGHYFYGDFCNGWVRSFRVVDGVVTERTEWPELGVGNLFSFGRDAAGELYVLDGSTVSRITVG